MRVRHCLNECTFRSDIRTSICCAAVLRTTGSAGKTCDFAIAAGWIEFGIETLTTDVPYGFTEWGNRDEDHYRQPHCVRPAWHDGRIRYRG